MADTNQLFQQAVNDYDRAYLDAEAELRAGGESTAIILQQIAADKNQPPLARFIAASIAAWIDGKGNNYEIAMNSLGGLVAHAERTPKGLPSPDVAAGRLARFDDISDFVALRLLKETDWPQWKVMAAVMYLGFWATDTVLPALDQFRMDLKSGKRKALGDPLDEQTQAVIEKLDEAAGLVRIVIADESFKEDIQKVEQSTGTEKDDAAVLAVTQALSVITADPKRAKRVETMVADIQGLFLQPILQATDGVIEPEVVRSILAKFLLGSGENA